MSIKKSLRTCEYVEKALVIQIILSITRDSILNASITSHALKSIQPINYAEMLTNGQLKDLHSAEFRNFVAASVVSIFRRCSWRYLGDRLIKQAHRVFSVFQLAFDEGQFCSPATWFWHKQYAYGSQTWEAYRTAKESKTFGNQNVIENVSKMQDSSVHIGSQVWKARIEFDINIDVSLQSEEISIAVFV